MRMLSANFAQDGLGKIILAYRPPQGQKEQHKQYYCYLCGCPMVLLSKELNRGPRFEHDIEWYPAEKLRKCSYYDGKDKGNEQLEKIREALRTLGSLTPVTHWHCVMCQCHYDGPKYCDQCHTGIFSIADAGIS
ncbi:zinc-ribbon domain-containing protein [Enterobacteriaceae bacterium H11S18]|uniref:putative zinc ribbon protein n=1 Tax=Dryocola clanedunensis TaxID=2925396 RepID=UPI0022F02999|nr:putative zinc ribbon protein [Dryocola clanedunensis]MCT4710742.1 zinc-ribbon domain-containing protein [Dryocola clanedunensis]